MIWKRIVVSVAWLILAGVIAQFYFVGLAVFGVTDFTLHALTGTLLIPISLVLAIMIVGTRSVRPMAWRGFGLFLLFVLQPVLALVPRVEAPAISALHPLVALMILSLAVSLTRVLAPQN